MKLLAIDTSTDACTVALMVDSDIKVDHRIASQQHASLVLPMVDQLFSEMQIGSTQLDAVVFGQGPGSFTGVRIGIAVAQGIAFGADVGVVGVSTLQSIAQGCSRQYGDDAVHVCVDARMDEVYYCHFSNADQTSMMPTVEEQIFSLESQLIAIEASADSASSFCWAGTGAERYKTLIGAQFNQTAIDIRINALPHAQDLLSLAIPVVEAGGMLAAEFASPVYLRNNVAKTTAEREQERALLGRIKSV